MKERIKKMSGNRVNKPFANLRELGAYINKNLGRRGVNDYALSNTFPFYDVPFKEDGLAYTLYRSTLMNKEIQLVKDPLDKDRTVAEVIYSVDPNTGAPTVLEEVFRL